MWNSTWWLHSFIGSFIDVRVHDQGMAHAVIETFYGMWKRLLATTYRSHHNHPFQAERSGLSKHDMLPLRTSMINLIIFDVLFNNET